MRLPKKILTILQHMDVFIIVLIILALLILIVTVLFLQKRKPSVNHPLPANLKKLLSEEVNFYIELNEEDKSSFENRMQNFLSRVKITGIGTEVEDRDKVLIAASAIIPIFGFPDWEYMNLNEILLYPDAFNEQFEQKGQERNTLGVVGTGAYQNMMILSKQGLREGFANKTGKTNVAIHEFVHLIDKTDGAVDGIPEFLMSRQYTLPWLSMMQKEISRILNNHSDINPYGATNQSEFLAVASEYFFERPDLLSSKHPELYQLLVTIFRQQPRTV